MLEEQVPAAVEQLELQPCQLRQVVVAQRAVGVDQLARDAPGIHQAQALQVLQDLLHRFAVDFHAAAAVTTPFLYQAAKFDIERDTDVVATLGYTPMMLVTTPGSPYRTVADLVAAAKGGEDSDLVIGSPTRGSIPSLSVYLMGQLSDRDFRQVSFSGTSQALQTLIKGDIPVYIDGVAPLVPLVRAGKLVPIAMSADEALPGFESIPLVKSTLPGMVTSGWFAVFAPKGTPAGVLESVNAAINDVLRESDVQGRLADIGTFPMIKTRSEAGSFVHEEKTKWGGVITKAQVKAE
ncbi:hypothetical protein G6F57_014117 [Rhizopus arrhizus]|nr:hypothetical protein G6F57_014117 [Rhizopus arrhizus]